MKKCEYCKINVGGDIKHCPLCQSPLSGYDEQPYWPAQASLKKASTLYKALVFAVISAVIVCYFLDYRLLPGQHVHFSQPVFVYALIGLPSLFLYIRRHNSIPRLLLRSMIIASIVLAYTGWFTGNLEFVGSYIIPAISIGTLVLNFIFCFIDAGFTEDSMLCIFCNIVVGVIPAIAMMIFRGPIPILWNITLMLSIITFLGILVFKGRVFIIELQKRFNM